MMIKSIRWLGTRTDRFDEMVQFYGKIFGLPKTHGEPGFAAFDLPNGDRVEVFADTYESHKHFTTGPVGGFEVDHIQEARRELEEKGIKFIGPIDGDSERTQWSHFKGPDGNIYELTQTAKSA